MAVNSGEKCQNVHSVVVVLPDRGATNPETVPNVCIVEVPHVTKNEICLNSKSDLLNHANPKVGKVNDYAAQGLDADVEKGKAESSEEAIGYSKFDDLSARAQQKGICLQTGGKLIGLLTNHSPELSRVTVKDRLVTQRVYDAPSNRSRKLKRSSSFSSRRVFLLFSVMSSIGTIILIYLTLRVRLISGSTNNV